MMWKPGDRVIVRLPYRPHGRYAKARDYKGTVREIDTVEGRPGVRVDLDEMVNGVQGCYATHAELRPVT